MCYVLQGEPLDAAGGEATLALYSQPLSVSCAAKLSRQQLVGFTWKAAGFDSVWQVGCGTGGSGLATRQHRSRDRRWLVGKAPLAG